MEHLTSRKSGHQIRRNIALLSRDDLLKVFSLLSPRSLACSSMVCRDWYNVVKTSRLWQCAYIDFRKSLVALHGDEFVSNLGLLMSELGVTANWETQYVKDHHKALLVCGSVTVTDWKGHTGRVNCCKMRMGTVATGSSDGTVCVWSAASLGCLERHIAPTKTPIVDLEFDENKIIGLSETELCLWSRGKSRLLRSIRGHNQRAFCMCYVDPEVGIGCGDGTVRIFDLYTGRCARIFRQHSEFVSCVTMDENATILASGSADGTLKLCDAVSGQKVACLLSSCPPTGVGCLFMNYDSSKVFAGTTSGQIYSWDLRTYKLLWRNQITPSSITSIHAPIFDPYTLVVGGISGVSQFLNANTGDIIAGYVRGTRLKSKKVATNSIVSRHVGVYVESPLEDIPVRNRPMILSARLGMNKAVTTHPDGTIGLWHFQLQLR